MADGSALTQLPRIHSALLWRHRAESALLVGALQSLFATSVVLFVPSAATVSDLAERLSDVPEIPSATMSLLNAKVFAWLASGKDSVGEDSVTVDHEGWHLVMSESRYRLRGTDRGGRRGKTGSGSPGLDHERDHLRADVRQAVCRRRVAEDSGPRLPTRPGSMRWSHRIAVELMSVSANSMADSLEWMLQVLCEFFEVDISFLRRTDFEREMSVLVAEWPPRLNIPDPDPLGEVPFGSDPIFDGTRDLKEPFTVRPNNTPDAYQERVQEGSGIDEVSVAVVPLIRGDTTIGVLGFIKFGDRPWRTEETNALQAVASLMVQLGARVDAEEQLRLAVP